MSAERAAPRVAGYDVEAVRRDFPILATTVHDKPLVYLDSAASAQKPRAVIEAESALYEGYYSNVHRGVHQLSVQSTEAYEAARGKARAFLGAREVGFTVLSMSLALVAVFLPFMLAGGLIGRLFREFTVTLSVSILISLVISLTTIRSLTKSGTALTPFTPARTIRPPMAA